MAHNKITPKLIFRTLTEQGKTYCGAKKGHRFCPRNLHGHDPGWVYIMYIPKGDYYHIGKRENPGIDTDDFNLEEMDLELLGRLVERLNQYHPARTKTDLKYDGAQFIHAIRVACAQGAESQVHTFFDKMEKRKRFGKKAEVFDLTVEDIKIFKAATGEVLDRPIKHITAKEFSGYLLKYWSEKTIRERVILPDNKKITFSRLKKYLSAKNYESHRSSKKPPKNNVSGRGWYEVNGQRGTELPTFIKRCIEGFRTLQIAFQKGVDTEDVIARCNSHPSCQNYVKNHVTAEQWQMICEKIRSAKSL